MATIREMFDRNSAARFAAPAALGAAAVLALGACGGGTSPTASASAARTPAGPASSGPGARTPQAEMRAPATLEKAGATAAGRVPGGTLVSIELEENGTVWETEVVAADGTEHAIDVHTRDGSVGASHVKRESAAKHAEHRQRVRAAKIDYRAAAAKARAAVRDGKITELNLDDHRGTTVWESDVTDTSGTKHEVRIDAASGALLANRTASGDDD